MIETTNDSSDDCGHSALTDVLRIADRLRKCLRFDAPTPGESELELAARDAADELELLAAHCERLELWQLEGEALFGQRGVGAAFSLGAWWADRPWRDRSASRL